jgi:hypothetical protein
MTMSKVFVELSMSLDGFVALGAGVRLFDHLGAAAIELERTRVIEAHGVTHLRFRVVK